MRLPFHEGVALPLVLAAFVVVYLFLNTERCSFHENEYETNRQCFYPLGEAPFVRSLHIFIIVHPYTVCMYVYMSVYVSIYML
jgi:hypothetical protein